MALNFPLNPADGDTYENYVYDATEGVWNANPQQLASRFITSATQPSTPSNGDGWLDTNTGKTYIYYNDGSSAQWIESGNPVIGFVDPYDQDSTSTGYFSLPKGTSAQRPVAPSNGDIRFNTELGEPEYYSEAEGAWFLFRQAAITEFSVEYLVLAGGGAGGERYAGGGGAGGYLTATLTDFVPGTYTVTVGAGGALRGDRQHGGEGADSVFSSFTANGGGGGGAENEAATTGGSGGGGTGLLGSSSTTNGASETAGQGSAGGNGYNNGTSSAGGGGGGAGGVGGNGSVQNGGSRGAGSASSITGSSVTYAEGGGGGSEFVTGLGGGSVTKNGATNLGGGGGGEDGNNTFAGTGGSGVVILKYPSSITATPSVGLTSITNTVGDYKVTQFTAGTGTVTFS